MEKKRESWLVCPSPFRHRWLLGNHRHIHYDSAKPENYMELPRSRTTSPPKHIKWNLVKASAHTHHSYHWIEIVVSAKSTCWERAVPHPLAASLRCRFYLLLFIFVSSSKSLVTLATRPETRLKNQWLLRRTWGAQVNRTTNDKHLVLRTISLFFLFFYSIVDNDQWALPISSRIRVFRFCQF